MRILHVTDCYAGGVSRAIDEIAKATPKYEHFLLHAGTDSPDGTFASSQALPVNIWKKTVNISNYAEAVNADLIFAHSSFAGFYTRITPKNVPIIYQPHCFAFHDVNRPAIVRAIFFQIEKLLARRTAAFLTLNIQEQNGAMKFPGSAQIEAVYNKPHLSIETLRKTNLASNFERQKVVMVGRLTPQKNPSFFAQVAQLVIGQNHEVEFVWIGDGDSAYRTLLTNQGVKVTGWLSRDDLTTEILSASIYFHSADYEGFPISVLDAAIANLPIIVRQIPCFDDRGLCTISTPQDAAILILNLLSNPDELSKIAIRSQNLINQMPPKYFGAVYDKMFSKYAKRE